MNDERQEEDRMEAAILRYLGEHPHAMDTLEGVAEWWLARERIRTDVRRLATALRRLVDRGFLEEVGTGQARMYRLRS